MFGDDQDDGINVNLDENQLPSDDENENAGPFGEDNENDNNEAGAKVEPKKKTVRNPRHRLTVDTLRGKRGIHTIEEYFKDIKFAGKGHERSDLNEVMRRMKHWAHRMYPTYKFEDVLTNIERLGKKKPLQIYMSRYRLGMLEQEILPMGQEADDEPPPEDEPFDEFDALLGEQIAISKLAPKTPGHNRTTMSITSSITTPKFGQGNAAMSTPYTGAGGFRPDDSDLALPLPLSQPSTPVPGPSKLSAEQIAKIAENRRLAQERLKAKREAAALANQSLIDAN